jgi:hypothetical protein
MKLKLAVLPLALAVAAVAASPALAKSKKHHHVYPYAAPYAYAPYAGAPLVSRNVSDPSFGNRAGINYARGTGRCVEDLGYGRYEYCGW